MIAVRRTLLLACTALCALLALPATGSAAKIEYGLQAERHGSQTLTEAEVMRMREGGARFVRTPLEWELVQRDGPDASYDFSNFDQLVQWATQGDLPKLEILPILLGSPGWVEKARNNNEPPVTDRDLEAWEKFVQAAVERYGRGGAIKHWQVWNEPNLKIFWTEGKPDASEYARFLERTDNAIKRADPNAKTVLAGMPQRKGAPHPMAPYLEDLYDVPGFKRSFDIAAVHPFGKNERRVLDAVEDIRDVMKDNRDKRTPLWVTEVGYASAGPPSEFTESPRGQAKRLTKTLGLLERKRNKLGLERIVWFNFRDSDTDPPRADSNDRWQTYTGLFTYEGEAKPSWDAYTALTGGDPRTGSLPPL